MMCWYTLAFDLLVYQATHVFTLASLVIHVSSQYIKMQPSIHLCTVPICVLRVYTLNAGVIVITCNQKHEEIRAVCRGGFEGVQTNGFWLGS